MNPLVKSRKAVGVWYFKIPKDELWILTKGEKIKLLFELKKRVKILS